jgi:hypothetical protein
MTNFLSYAQVRILRAESQFERLVSSGGLLSFPRTGCALLRYYDGIMEQRCE